MPSIEASINELLNYIRHESSDSSSSNNVATQKEILIRRHALEQLIEANFGDDVSAAVVERRGRSTTTGDSGHHHSSSSIGEQSMQKEDSAEFRIRMVVKELMDSTSLCRMRDALRKCSLHHRGSCTTTTTTSSTLATTGDDNATTNSKKVDLPDNKLATKSTSSPAPPTSFSLFAFLDSQGGGGGLMFPPRIMASQIIDAYRRENETNALSSTTSSKVGTVGTDELTTLELLEKAEDMEDLSPDSESWEEIRSILFVGLFNNSNLDNGNDEVIRYLRVHETFINKCRGNDALKVQLWGLAQNMIGSILAHCVQCGDDSSSVVMSKQSLEFCWDALHSLINILSQMAVDYVMSSVGNEWEIERMLLGLCMMLSNDFVACTLAMIEPMAGFFEVWSRFVNPKRFIAMVHASGLGGVLLRRCDCFGKSAASEIIWNNIQPLEITTSLDDIEYCNYLQSLSILRTILFRCDGSPQIVSLIHKQFTDANNSEGSTNCVLSSLLFSQGIASPRDVQTLIWQAEELWKQQWNQTVNRRVDDELHTVLKPFRHVLRVNESNFGSVDKDLHLLCSQAIDIMMSR